MRERITEFLPAWDKRNSDPKKNYGIHGVELRMVLKGPEGAVQFVLYTKWMLPHVQDETDDRIISEGADRIGLKVFYRPMPADLGYHSPKPMYEGHEAMGSVKYNFTPTKTNIGLPSVDKVETGKFNPCPYLDGKACYYDGSGLNAERIFDVLLREGSSGVWKELELYYDEIFKAELATN